MSETAEKTIKTPMSKDIADAAARELGSVARGIDREEKQAVLDPKGISELSLDEVKLIEEKFSSIRYFVGRDSKHFALLIMTELTEFFINKGMRKQAAELSNTAAKLAGEFLNGDIAMPQGAEDGQKIYIAVLEIPKLFAKLGLDKERAAFLAQLSERFDFEIKEIDKQIKG